MIQKKSNPQVKEILLFKINWFTPKLNLPAQEKDKTADKPNIENDIADSYGIIEESMVVHNSCGRINSQPK